MPRYPAELVCIEYDSRSTRVTKVFSDHYKAKAFYVLKYKQGKNPKVWNPSKEISKFISKLNDFTIQQKLLEDHSD
jgi:hypothetical protein